MPSANQNKNVSSESDSIDLGRLFGELIDHRKIIMSMIALFTFISLLYVSFATPIYQADALVQIEQKQGNSLINSLTQILPDSQPQSAPELALLQSRMILGKTVDDLNLDTVIEQEYFPIFGRGWARLTGEKPGEIQIGHYSILVDSKDAENELKLEIIDDANFLVEGNNQKIKGTVGSEIKTKDFVLLVKKIQAKSGTEFTITKQPRLKAIADLQ
ncbi:TPA: tyrosine-protein kinase, partial [Klebsiella pneumoniae subsp. pneumoniae]|nr:tyrosine-protein kinase [Klebsiella pneumoniae subsp. pneumoniae]